VLDERFAPASPEPLSAVRATVRRAIKEHLSYRLDMAVRSDRDLIPTPVGERDLGRPPIRRRWAELDQAAAFGAPQMGGSGLRS